MEALTVFSSYDKTAIGIDPDAKTVVAHFGWVSDSPALFAIVVSTRAPGE